MKIRLHEKWIGQQPQERSGIRNCIEPVGRAAGCAVRIPVLQQGAGCREQHEGQTNRGEKIPHDGPDRAGFRRGTPVLAGSNRGWPQPAQHRQSHNGSAEENNLGHRLTANR